MSATITASTNKTRVIWIDYAKGIGIILVVYGHVMIGLNNAKILQQGDLFTRYFLDFSLNFTYTFHMALFFFLSGLLASSKKITSWVDLSAFLRKKAVAILYPYLIWSLIQGSLNALMSPYTNAPFNILDLPGRILVVPIGHFWFLYVLFAYHVCFTLLSRFLRPPIVMGIACLIYLAHPYAHFFVVKAFAERFIYFVFGAVIVKQIPRLLERLQKVDVLLIAIGCLFTHLLLFWTYYFTYGVKTFNEDLSLAAIFGSLGIMSIVLFAFLLSHLNQDRLQFLVKLGQLSMPIYLIHLIVVVALRIVIHKFLGVSNLYFHVLTETLLGIVIPIQIYNFSKNNFLGLLFSPALPPRKPSFQ
jgi:fucose 4-O-acetylase-like acetyltransferase